MFGGLLGRVPSLLENENLNLIYSCFGLRKKCRFTTGRILSVSCVVRLNRFCMCRRE